MSIPNLIVNLSQKDIEENPFIKNQKLHFYRFLIERITGQPYSKETVFEVDCAKIQASTALIQNWEDTAIKSGMDLADFGMLMLAHGPKSSSRLKDNQIMLEPSAIVLTDGTRYPQSLMIL